MRPIPSLLRAVRRLVALFPPSAREYAPEMISTVVARRRSWGGPAALFWARELGSLAVSVAVAWFDAGRARSGSLGTRTAFEVRTSLRVLRRSPVFSTAIVATLALGVGANAGVGGLAWNALMAPLPFPEADRLVLIRHHADLTEGISLEELGHYRDAAGSLESAAGWRLRETTVQPAEGPAERIAAAVVTADLFAVLGRGPILGPGFGPEPVGSVVLSHRFWTGRLSRDPSVLDRTLRLDGRPYAVVGVLDPAVQLPGTPVDVYLPLVDRDAADPGRTFLDVVARLEDGVPLARASTEIDRMARAFPNAGAGGPDNGREGGYVEPIADRWRGDVGPLLLLTLGATGLLLLATCTNAALLVWSRRLRRAGELRVRSALGARRSDLVRTQVLETGLLTVLAGIAATGLAVAIGTVVPDLVPGLEHVARSRVPVLPATVAATIAVTVATGALVSAISLVRSRRSEGPELSGPGLLVPLQIGIALVLVSGSVMLVRSVGNLLAVDLGYRTEGVTTARISLPADGFATPASQLAFYSALARQLRSDRVAAEVGVTSSLPLSAYGGSGSVVVEAVSPDSAVDVISQRIADPGYFSVMRVPLLRGRGFHDLDRDGMPRVALVDEMFAERYFGGADGAVGQRIRFFMGGEDWNEVVGVVGRVRPGGPEADDVPVVYVPLAQRPTRGAHLVMTAPGPEDPTAAAIGSVVGRLDPGVPVSDVQTMRSRLHATIERQRIGLGVFSAFAAIALVLSAVGSHALAALAHERRVRELGIRKALGARPRQVAALTGVQTLRPFLAGVALGMVGSLAAGRALEALLFGLSSVDVASFGTAVGVLAVAVGFAAAPAIVRSWTHHPAEALRRS